MSGNVPDFAKYHGVTTSSVVISWPNRIINGHIAVQICRALIYASVSVCRGCLGACLLFLLEIRISWPAPPAWEEEGGGLFYCAALGKFGYLTDEHHQSQDPQQQCTFATQTSPATQAADEGWLQFSQNIFCHFFSRITAINALPGSNKALSPLLPAQLDDGLPPACHGE